MEILLIAAALLLIFGASKLPQLGRAFGDSIREFKKATTPDDGEPDEKKL
jgi:TatA/E family protein of Tat protein translocase